MASSSTVPLLTRLIAAAVNVSQKSARILRDVKKSGEMNVQEKGINDFVTKADFLSQLNIIKSLEKQFPKLKFCGEEGDLKEDYPDLELSLNETVLKEGKILPEVYQSIREEDLIVWVDPLDGTKEYTMDYNVANEVTVLIGVAWNGRPIAGVINQPFFKFQQESNSYLDRVLWGIVGLGGFDLTKGRISVTQNTTNLPTIVTTRSHITDLIQKNLNLIPNKQIIHSGGAGYKALALVDSKADYYIYPKNGTKRWDTCAPEALIQSLGGCMTDIFGNQYSYSKSEGFIEENYYGIIFSLGQNNSNICSYFNQELKDEIEAEAEKVRQKYRK
ncbi:3 (2)-5 -bisphosphate nucleotidase 1 [Brachionus plicatilis]|uniref:3'(2'),5'-bisphosphate nucleotidase 1 n=1 Tax=Brachionus plicatilis TaxID=10195 RepID=A0A3M7R9L3_BRAPC|nr:3 (2)-5 -bisphosphate nucleotidase 1 [Brachionus plicatilis]